MLLLHHVLPSNDPGFTVDAGHQAYLIAYNGMLRTTQTVQAGQRQAIVPAANAGEGQADHGDSHQSQAALGNTLEGKLMLLLGLLALTVIGLITAGLLLPVHTGKL